MNLASLMLKKEPHVTLSTKYLLAALALVIAGFLLFGCDVGAKPWVGPPQDPPTTDGGCPMVGGGITAECAATQPNYCTCVGQPCGVESSTCFTNCMPGSGCYVPTGYCVPDETGVCPPPPSDDKHHKKPHPCPPTGKHLGDKHCDDSLPE